jgi:GGDEF domain-containing protein
MEMKVRHALEGLNEFCIPFWLVAHYAQRYRTLEHRYGYGRVDAAMKMIAGTLDGNLGPLDVLTRSAKTEFRVEVYYSSRLELADIAAKLVSLVRVSTLDWWGDRVRVSISVGGALAEHRDTLESVEARAASVLEGCQASGGNRAAVGRPQGAVRK